MEEEALAERGVEKQHAQRTLEPGEVHRQKLLDEPIRFEMSGTARDEHSNDRNRRDREDIPAAPNGVAPPTTPITTTSGCSSTAPPRTNGS
jgi:hypothetical protein